MALVSVAIALAAPLTSLALAAAAVIALLLSRFEESNRLTTTIALVGVLLIVLTQIVLAVPAGASFRDDQIVRVG